MPLNTYSTGTISIAIGAVVVNGAGVDWSGVNARAGDTLIVAGHEVGINDVNSPTQLAIDAWPAAYGTIAAATAYKIRQNSPLRFVGGQAMADVSTAFTALNSLGPIFNVASTATVPDPSYGLDGQYAVQITTGKWWLKTAGAWVLTTAPVVNYGGTSVTSLTIATGAKVFATQANLGYSGARVRAASLANPGNFMEGTCTYVGSTLTMTVDTVGGAGTFADWAFSIGAGRSSFPIAASIHLGGTNYVYVPSNPNGYHYVVWTNIEYNDGGLWAGVAGGAGGGFVPPVGSKYIILDAQVWLAGGNLAASGNWVAKWYRNPTFNGSGFLLTGQQVKAGIGSPGDFSGTAVCRASCHAKVNPGDYFVLCLFVDSNNLGVASITVDGNDAHTYMQAMVF